MEITKEALLFGKPTIIKDREYLATKDYVDEFMTQMSKFTDKFTVHVQLPNQLTVSNSQKDIVYNRVLVQAIMPQKCDIDDYRETYNLSYALDCQNPVYKLYRAYINKDSQNLCTFDSKWCQTHTLEPNKKFTYSITSLMQMTSDFEKKLHKIQNTFISSDIKDNYTNLGKLIEKSLLYNYKTLGGKVKISPNDVVKTYYEIFHNTTSKFYIDKPENCTIYHYYDTLLTHVLDDKDINNKFEKTLLVGTLFNIVDYEENN